MADHRRDGTVFISYCHRDYDYAHRLEAELRRRKLPVWIDDRIGFGKPLSRVIQEQLNACAAVILIMTSDSYQSKWVQNELAYAMHLGKPVFPLLLEGHLWLEVAALLYVDVRRKLLPEERFYAELGTLLIRPDRSAETLPEAKPSDLFEGPTIAPRHPASMPEADLVSGPWQPVHNRRRTSPRLSAYTGPPGAKLPTFQDREEELADILAMDARAHILMLHGVHGIGKTRLLRKAEQRLQAVPPPQERPEVCLVDFRHLGSNPPESVLGALCDLLHRDVRAGGEGAPPTVQEIVGRLEQLAVEKKVYLFFDSTESLQADEKFWCWLESDLVGPLLPAAQVRFVFAGRVPAPWRSFEVRLALRHVLLDALPREEAALPLLEDCLKLFNDQLDPPTVQAVLPLLYEISQGHPGLSEQLARAASPQLPQMVQHLRELETVLRSVEVESFIEQDLCGDLKPPWPKILTWASVLDEFDAYTLEQYVRRVPELLHLVRDAPAYFYNRGIAEMRNQYALDWYEGRGYALHGVRREIIGRQFERLHPRQFEAACRAAAETYAAFAQAMQDDEPLALAYRAKAARYGAAAQSTDAQGDKSER